MMQAADVSNAFSAQSKIFDNIDLNNPLLIYLRKQVRDHVELFLTHGSSLLELNSGTGLDAIYFAKKLKVNVHATELSSGMIDTFQKKIVEENLSDSITLEQLSFENIKSVSGKNFDYVFSNFGGLNCTDNLTVVLSQLPPLLKPGAFITLVVMPKICPWEWLWLFRGNFSSAFRRFKKTGTDANVENIKFKTWYYSYADVKNMLGENFHPVKTEAMSLFFPPPQSTAFSKKYPRLLNSLKHIDEFFRTSPVLKTCGDHYIATFQFLPKHI